LDAAGVVYLRSLPVSKSDLCAVLPDLVDADTFFVVRRQVRGRALNLDTCLMPISLLLWNNSGLPENRGILQTWLVDAEAVTSDDFGSSSAASTKEIEDRSLAVGLNRVSASSNDSGGQIEIKSPPGPNLHIGSIIFIFSLILIPLVF